MTLLQINKDWRVDSDQYNWILQKRTVITKTDNVENIGKEVWRNEGYHPTLPAAVEALVDKAIKLPADVNGVIIKLDELIELVNERFASIETALQPAEAAKVPDAVREDDLEDFLS